MKGTWAEPTSRRERWSAATYLGFTLLVTALVVLAVVFAVAACILFAVGRPPTRAMTAMQPTRPLAEVARQPVFVTAVLAGVTAYAVMSFIMSATPISMHVVDGLPVDDTKSVISMHLLGMYLPSLASGWLIRVLGVRPMLLVGLGFMAVCVVISVFVGQHILHYVSALVLPGIGWNFLFVAGTTLLTTSYAPSERYRAQGLNDLVVFGVQALAALAAGPAITRLGWQAVNAASLPLLAIMAVAVVRLGMSGRPIRAAVAP